MSKLPTPTQHEAQNMQREQIIINTRLTALQAAQDILKIGPCAADIDGAKLVAEAKVIEAYITEGIDAIKPKSSLVIQANMPPPGAFKPGQ